MSVTYYVSSGRLRTLGGQLPYQPVGSTLWASCGDSAVSARLVFYQTVDGPEIPAPSEQDVVVYGPVVFSDGAQAQVTNRSATDIYFELIVTCLRA